MNSNTSQQQDLERAAQMVERFVRRFQPSYRLLAYHAALPLVLTPELVHFLRVQFLRSEDVPWVAEVDLLLSDLCRQVGYELYAMDTAVRAYLLTQMKRELGEQRMQDVAKLLINYVKYLHQTNSYISPQELQVQQWAAMVYLEEPRQQAVREIAEAFQQGLVNKAELARLARITQELAPQLKSYQNLLDYAELVSKVLTNVTQMKREDIRRSYEVLPGVELRLPKELIPQSTPSQRLGGGRNWAIAIGINYYENLPPLKYAKRDAEAMAAWFKGEAKFDQVFLFTDDSPPIATNPPITTQPTYGHLRRFLRAQFENIERPLLKPEDNLWFFFAGHGNRYKDNDYLMFSDSDPGDVEHTAISVNYVTQRLRRSGADNVLMFIDASRFSFSSTR